MPPRLSLAPQISSDYQNFSTHLECSVTGRSDYEIGKVQGLSHIGMPLLVRYDLAAMKKQLNKEDIWARPGGFWKWREFFPEISNENICSLGEDDTPLIACNVIAKEMGITGDLLVKDESRLPTGSFKARGLGLACAMAKELGITRVAMPTNGNAGSALAAYANRAGLESFIFCPNDAPPTMAKEMSLLGGNVWRVNGMINDCGRIVAEGVEEAGWFDVSTQKEPYRIEGKKTMGLELAAQLGWDAPDAIIYSTGGGMGLVGMWKAFQELSALGWIGDKMPKMIAVQSEGCAPIVKAYDEGADKAEFWPDAFTHAAGIRVPFALGGHLILKAIKESGGFAVTATEEEIIDARLELAQKDAIHVCPEGASTLVAYRHAIETGLLQKSDRTVLFNCGNGLKYPMPEVTASLDQLKPIDYSIF